MECLGMTCHVFAIVKPQYSFKRKFNRNFVISVTQADRVHLFCPGFFILFYFFLKENDYMYPRVPFSEDGFCHLLCC